MSWVASVLQVCSFAAIILSAATGGGLILSSTKTATVAFLFLDGEFEKSEGVVGLES